MGLVILASVLVGAAAIGGLAIWRMEIQRRRAIGEGIVGTVAGKRHSAEHGELGLPARGAGAGGIRIAPESWLLTIQTSVGSTEIIVDEETYADYSIGDEYPHITT